MMRLSLSSSLVFFALLCIASLAGCKSGQRSRKERAHDFYRNRKDLPPAIEPRYRRTINFLADEYVNRAPDINIGDPEKYYFPIVIARLEKYGPQDSLATRLLRTFKEHPPFHFTLIGLSRILYRYPEAQGVKQFGKDYLRTFWDRQDSYAPWYTEGTENHISMAKTSGYLLAQYSKNHYPEAFPQAEKRMAETKAWIKNWSKRLYQNGSGEWNSSTYGAYNLIGWLNLYDFAKDAEVKAMARAVCDYYATEFSLHYMQGTVLGPEMRGGGFRAFSSATATYCWYWFGDYQVSKENFGENRVIQSVHAATSSYLPPKPIRNLLRRKGFRERWMVGAKPDYLMEEPGLNTQFEYRKGPYHLGSIRTRYGGYGGGSHQIFSWKAVARNPNGPDPYILSGNGHYYDTWTGKRRDPYLQTLQWKNVLFQLYKLPDGQRKMRHKIEALFEEWDEKWHRDFVQRFPQESYKVKQPVVSLLKDVIAQNRNFIHFPARAQCIVKGRRAFLNLGATYAQVMALSSEQIDLDTVPGPGKKQMKKELDYLFDAGGKHGLNGLVLELAAAEKFSSFQNFMQQMQQKTRLRKENERSATYLSHRGDSLRALYQDSGSFQEPLYDWGFGPTKPQTQIHSPPFRQPDWPKGQGYGKTGRLQVNGQWRYDEPPEYIYRSKEVAIGKGKLRLGKNENPRYLVDYTEQVPEFPIP